MKTNYQKKIFIFTVSLISVIFLLLVFSTKVLAESKNSTDDPAWTIYFRPAVRFGSNDRVLYVLDFLIPLYQTDKNILFFNPKFTPNDHDGCETNLGIGYRHLLLDDSIILGLNAFYDRRKTDWGTNHSQWGIGAEVMAEIPIKESSIGFTGRFNFYYPLSHHKVWGSGGSGFFFQGNGIFSGGGIEEPMRGLDYEAGIRIPYISDYIETWVYAGGYNYHGRHVSDVNGFMSRLEIIPADFLRLNLEYRNDNINHDEFFGEVALEIPFSIDNLISGKNPFEGIGDMICGSRKLSERLVEPVRRDVDIIIVREGGGAQEMTMVEEIVFVSEGGEVGPSPDGTFEHPWPSIATAMGDPRLGVTAFTIHVINDDGGDGVAGGGTVNIEDLLIWGAGVNHPTCPNITNMIVGHPTLNETLTLDAANLTVAGLGFNLLNNGTSAITIDNGDRITISNNIINITNSGNASGIYSNTNFDIGTDTNPLLIANNTINVSSTGGDAYGIYLESTGGGILYGQTIAPINQFDLPGVNDLWGVSVGLDTGLYISDENSQYIVYLIDSTSGAILDSFNYSHWEGKSVLATDFGDDLVYVSVYPGGPIFAADDDTGYNEVINFGAPTSWLHDATFHGGDLYLIEHNGIGGTYRVFRVNDTTGAMLGSFNVPSECDSIASWGGYLLIGNSVDPNNVISVVDASVAIAGGNMSDGLVGEFYLSNSGFRGIGALGNDLYVSQDNTTGTNDRIYHYDLSDLFLDGKIYTDIDCNNITVNSISGDSYGIYGTTGSDIYTTITNNDMTGGISGNNSYGIGLFSNSGLIGSTTYNTIVNNNSGVINGSTSRYMLRLSTGDIGGGNYVDWGGLGTSSGQNDFVPLSGGTPANWSGNFGNSGPQADGPLIENFDETGVDTLTPP